MSPLSIELVSPKAGSLELVTTSSVTVSLLLASLEILSVSALTPVCLGRGGEAEYRSSDKAGEVTTPSVTVSLPLASLSLFEPAGLAEESLDIAVFL